MKCFFIYFSPLIFYLRNVLQLTFNDFVWFGSLVVSLLLTGSIAAANYFLEHNFFGVSNLLILIVMGTIAGNTGFGIWKSILMSKAALVKAQKKGSGPEHRLQMKLHKRYQFDYKKLQFVFFKSLTFLAYLKIAVTFLNENDGFLDWTSAGVIQTPIAIMWYVEWKSIGENSEYIFGKKAPIFVFTEFFFEAKFFTKYFNKDKPEDPEA